MSRRNTTIWARKILTDDELRAALRRYIETDREDARSDRETEMVVWEDGEIVLCEPLSRVTRLLEEILRDPRPDAWRGLL